MREYKKIVLDNGIPLYLCNDKSFKQTFVGYVVKYGFNGYFNDFILDGNKYHVNHGNAHFIEHLIGERSKFGDMYTNFTERGLYSNAYTTGNHTMYYFCGQNDVMKSIRELIEAIDDPVFNKKDVDKTRKAIGDEASSSMDEISSNTNHLLLRNLYKGFEMFPRNLSSIGDKKNSRLVTYDELVKCYDAFYSDDNKVLVIAGNVNEEELVEYLNNIYSKIKPHSNRVLLPDYDYDTVRKYDDTVYKDVDIDINGIGIKIKKPDDLSVKEFTTVFSFLCEQLFDSDSVFLGNMRDNGLIDVMRSYMMDRVDGYGNFVSTFLSSHPDEYIKRVIDKINANDMTKDEFDLIKRTLLADELRLLDDKYENTKYFGCKIFYTEDYSDMGAYQDMTYDRYREIMDKLDFNTNIKAKVKKK